MAAAPVTGVERWHGGDCHAGLRVLLRRHGEITPQTHVCRVALLLPASCLPCILRLFLLLLILVPSDGQESQDSG